MEDYACKKTCKASCIVEVLISIILGVVTGIVFSRGLIASVFNFSVVALVATAIAIVIFVGMLFASKVLCKYNSFEKCICKIGACLLTAIIGTIIFGTVTLSIEIIVTSVISILSVGFTAFFFIWMILSIISLIWCIIKDICNK